MSSTKTLTRRHGTQCWCLMLEPMLVRQDFCAVKFFKCTMPPKDFGRGTVKFQNFGELLKVKGSEKFKSMTARIECLKTLAGMNNDLEVSQQIDVVNDLKISKKHLIIVMETLNTTLLRKKAINFNVEIHHKESGEALYGAQSLKYFWCQRLIINFELLQKPSLSNSKFSILQERVCQTIELREITASSAKKISLDVQII